MSFTDLRNLHRLHLVDSAIVEIRKRAASLDPGKAILAKIAALEKELDEVGGNAKALAGEQADLELKQKTIDAKIAQIDKDLYSGKVVNPREVEAFQKEIENQKKRRSEMDERLLELMELTPPAKAAADAIQTKIDDAKHALTAHQKEVVQAKGDLERQFKEISAKRVTALADVPQAMLLRYDAIRQRTGGVGMADVVKGNFCGMCGTHLPEKLIEGAKDGRIVTCESCHRILYASDGII
jgi:predicted  nucleic acid-binding Zn-ribbon protein